MSHFDHLLKSKLIKTVLHELTRISMMSSPTDLKIELVAIWQQSVTTRVFCYDIQTFVFVFVLMRVRMHMSK